MNNKKILVLDIGGTNTSAAVINSGMSILELKKVAPVKIRSIGRMNKSLPKIILEFSQFKDYEEIVINVPFEVNKDKNIIEPHDYYVKKQGVPSNFPYLVSQITNKPVYIENDAVAWMRGNLKFQELVGKEILFPAITLCLGTGVGMAIAKSSMEIEEYNISKKLKGKHFPELTKTAGYYFKDQTAGKVQGILGKGFLNWVEKKRKNWSYEKISEEYTKRFVALIRDLEQNSPLHFHRVRSMFLCGGNSIYLNNKLIEHNGIDIYYHREDYLGFSPDIIPLIGSINNGKFSGDK